jgi:nitroimidazol reductase NimA-like FMN-containing flavoprotein (pyridoxamine 5'-phosphate oxidase superfamily)
MMAHVGGFPTGRAEVTNRFTHSLPKAARLVGSCTSDRANWSAMDALELADELGQPGARELLDSPAAHLAYDGPDGFPRVIPVGFLWKADRIIVCTATTSPKVAALTSRPHVAVAIDAGDSPQGAKSLLIRGVAALQTVDGVADEFLEMSTKSMDAHRQAAFEREVRRIYKQQVRISIEPLWARFFDYGAGRIPTFLQKLVDH